MDFPVALGEKYALIALDAGAELQEPLVLGGGYLAVPRGAFDLPSHWKEWLGTIRTKAIERAHLVLMAKAASDRPSVLDAENQHLQQRVSNLYWGLLASGRVRVSGAGTQLTGSHDEDGIDVRQVGDLDRIISVYGLLTAAPIRTGEFYFCRFYNHSWHMGLTTMGVGWQPFYLGGKVGPVEHGIKANDFANASVNPANSQLLSTLLLNADGRLKPEYEGGGCSKVEIFKSEREIFIRINDSPPKSFYMKHDLYDRPKGPVVDNLEGYFPGPARARFMETILAEIKRLGEQSPKKIVDDDG